jgi:hypothetical protein
MAYQVSVRSYKHQPNIDNFQQKKFELIYDSLQMKNSFQISLLQLTNSPNGIGHKCSHLYPKVIHISCNLMCFYPNRCTLLGLQSVSTASTRTRKSRDPERVCPG